MPKFLPSAPTPGGGRLTRGRRVSATLADINVIPLVDVMLVLLIIFFLAARMRQMMINRTDRQVFLRGDGGVELQELLDIMDRLKAAGVEKVGIVSKLPGEQLTKATSPTSSS